MAPKLECLPDGVFQLVYCWQVKPGAYPRVKHSRLLSPFVSLGENKALSASVHFCKKTSSINSENKGYKNFSNKLVTIIKNFVSL